MLKIDNVRFSFDKPSTSVNSESTQKHLQMNFNLVVEKGEILSVIGPSGSGKTTLLNLIAGFVTPSSGQILVDQNNTDTLNTLPVDTSSIDASLVDISLVDIVPLDISQRPVTTVFQENNLFSHLNVFTNVAIGIQPSLKLNESETQQVQDALKSVGLESLAKRQPKELSGGQRQRVALARALVRKHSVLLLDEPLAALGPAMREEIIDLLKELVENNQMTALLISHQPEDAMRASKRVAFIHDGNILTIDKSEALLVHSHNPIIQEYLGTVNKA